MKSIWVIFKKEVASFFNSLIGYLVITVFLIGIGLFFWVFTGNVLESGMAQMDVLFSMAPWFFLFLIPAITMRFFAEEFKSGTIEFLATKPLTDWHILLGKYFAAVALVAFSLAPTFVYFWTIYFLACPTGNLDTGAIIGAYIGLFGIGCVFASIGVFSSSITENQIVAFVAGLFLCFILFSGFDFLSELPVFGSFNETVLLMGVMEHYRSISRGVVDTRDVVYYLSVIIIFLALTKVVLTRKKS